MLVLQAQLHCKFSLFVYEETFQFPVVVSIWGDAQAPRLTLDICNCLLATNGPTNSNGCLPEMYSVAIGLALKELSID